MNRIMLALSTAAMSVVLTASVALAQYPPTSAPPGGPPDPLPGGDAGSTLPFTGANISWGLILLGALVITGVVLLFAARRRSRV
jgi:LPXTG-motif cell wall-anchored protein